MKHILYVFETLSLMKAAVKVELSEIDWLDELFSMIFENFSLSSVIFVRNHILQHYQNKGYVKVRMWWCTQASSKCFKPGLSVIGRGLKKKLLDTVGVFIAS